MPRKAKLGMPLVIERLSDGREVRPEAFRDDFTGEMVPMVQDTRPARELVGGFELREKAQREREAKAKALLAKVMPRAKPDRTLGEHVVTFRNTRGWRRV